MQRPDTATAIRRHPPASARAGGFSPGFSLIELMVGIVISVICVLGMMAAFAAYEGPKRTTTSGDDAQQNGSFALFELERQIRTAGSGFTQGNAYNLWGCPIAYNGSTAILNVLPAPFNTWSTGTTSKLLAMPVLIAAGSADGNGNATSDTLAIAGGNPAGTVFAGTVQSASATSLTLDNTFGVAVNDYLIGVPATVGGNCAVDVVSQVAAAPDNQITLAQPLSANVTPVHVFDIGPQPVFSLYGVNTPTSTMVTFDLIQRPGSSSTPLPVADGIVAIKALYGVDDGNCGTSQLPGCGTAGDGIIDEWVQPTGTWAINTLTASSTTAAQAATKIKAIRLAVVARSQLPEQASVYTGATTLTLFQDLPAGLQYTITTQTQYRYKVYDTVVPIRNMLISRFY